MLHGDLSNIDGLEVGEMMPWPDDVVESIVKHVKGDDVLNVRLVATTWNRRISHSQMSEVFARQDRSLRFLFDRIWLKDLFARSDT